MTVLQGEANIAPPRQTARQLLRESTHAAHQRLEDLVEAGGYFDTQAGYLNWLDRMLAVHTEYLHPINQGARLCGLLPNGQTLVAALRADLGRTMNTPVIEPEIAGHPVDALGALYVFEGSALGGKLLLRRLDGLAGCSAKVPDAADRTFAHALARGFVDARNQAGGRQGRSEPRH